MVIKYLALGMTIGLAACTTTPEHVNTIVKTPLNTHVVGPNCPDWTKASGGDYENTPYSNFRCSNITNYGLMIENPDDMVTGRQSKLGNAATAANAVSAYESGAAPAAAGGAGVQ